MSHIAQPKLVHLTLEPPVAAADTRPEASGMSVVDWASVAERVLVTDTSRASDLTAVTDVTSGWTLDRPDTDSLTLFPSTIVVTRLGAGAAFGTCALCWLGPCELPGLVHGQHEARVCGRCLVTLEMLALHFGAHLRVQVEPAA